MVYKDGLVPTRALMVIWPYIRILGIVWLETCVKYSLKNDLSYEINYVIIDGLLMKLSIIILRLPSNHGANIRTNQGGLRRCHCTVNLLASVTMTEGGCAPSLSNLRLMLKIQSIYYIECHMTYKYVYVFYCASINVVEIFRASYDVSDLTITDDPANLDIFNILEYRTPVVVRRA